jgi:hypothetical protein
MRRALAGSVNDADLAEITRTIRGKRKVERAPRAASILDLGERGERQIRIDP